MENQMLGVSIAIEHHFMLMFVLKWKTETN